MNDESARLGLVSSADDEDRESPRPATGDDDDSPADDGASGDLVSPRIRNDEPWEDGPGPAVLEERYRRLLRILPRAYRDVREDEMVATFLAAEQEADPENFDLNLRHGSPSWPERRSVAALALRLRLANPLAPASSRLRVAAVQRALFGFLLLFAAMSLTSAITAVAFLLWPPALLDAATPAVGLQAAPLWWTVTGWAFLAWIPALACALRGGRAALAWAAVFAAVPTVVAGSRLFTEVAGYWTVDRIVTFVVYAAVTLLIAALAVAGSGMTAEHARRWFVIAGAAALALGVAWAVISIATPLDVDAGPSGWMLVAGGLVVDEVGPLCWGVLLAAVVIAVRARRGADADAASLLGLGYLAMTILLLRLPGGIAWILGARGADPGAVFVAVLAGIAAQVFALVLVMALSLRAARRATSTAERVATAS